MTDYQGSIVNILNNWGVQEDLASFLYQGSLFVILALFMLLFDKLTKSFIHNTFGKLVKSTKTKWDDIIFEKGVLDRLAHIVPAIILYNALPLLLTQGSWASIILQKGTLLYILVVTTSTLSKLLQVVEEIYRTYLISKKRPIKGYLQLINIFFYFLALILAFSIILDKSAVGLLSGIGALTAVLMLVFKDSILGLVASIQLSANNMVQIGDWIEMPKYGADGDVVDITLQSIKVQNWDKTLTTIPIYSLISDSFKNWRGMTETGGRRIKRSIYIDVNSIGFCSQELIEKFEGIELLSSYIEKKKEEIAQHNQNKQVKMRSNLRSLTNIGTFRAYVEAYIKAHPLTHHGMTTLVRQLPPGPNGIPIEIYVFSKDTAWANYEALQADIFDHLLALLPEFELHAFQNPSGRDIRQIKERDI